MNIWQAVIMGLVQGFTEFLPVSSSGHLVIARNVLGITAEPLLFEIILHVGTLVAVCIVFWKELWNMIRHPFSKPVLMLVIATIPAVLAALFLSDFIETAFGGQYLAIGFLFTAVFLVAAESLKPKSVHGMRDMNAKDAVSMGVMQAIALIPGISRSGSTIVGGLLAGLKRESATRFAFLMSVPAILGSLVFKIKDFAELGSSETSVFTLIIGALVAALSGYFAIRFMLRLVSRKKLYGFAIYVAILGAFILLDQTVFHLFF